MQLPLLKTFDLLQTRWKSLLDPIIANPATNMAIIKGIKLAIGDNQIAHLLGRVQQGWTVLDIDGVASYYRSRPFNDTYFYLNSSAVVTVNIGVF